MGVPVVSTAIGAEGLLLTAGQEVLLEDTATGLAAAAVRLLHDESLRRQLSQAGRARAVRDYDWSQITATFGRSLAELEPRFTVSEAMSG
ncbi:MAG: glycosyltransferase, partial [Planctomycetaceae bacterium]